MDEAELTSRQRDIYEFIADKITNRGYGPTVSEIGLEFGILSPNGVVCHLKALEKKGLITREPNMSRAIQLTKPRMKRTSLALAGQVAAGTPLLAVQQDERIDFGDLFGQEDHFCLRVNDDSLSGESIAQGDFVIVHRRRDAHDGEVVVALNGDAALLRRFRKHKGRARLDSLVDGSEAVHTSDLDIIGVVQPGHHRVEW